MIKIDRNVQIPEARCNYPFEDMGCGDSILFIEERRAASARVAAVRFAKRHRPGAASIVAMSSCACWIP